MYENNSELKYDKIVNLYFGGIKDTRFYDQYYKDKYKNSYADKYKILVLSDKGIITDLKGKKDNLKNLTRRSKLWIDCHGYTESSFIYDDDKSNWLHVGALANILNEHIDQDNLEPANGRKLVISLFACQASAYFYGSSFLQSLAGKFLMAMDRQKIKCIVEASWSIVCGESYLGWVRYKQLPFPGEFGLPKYKDYYYKNLKFGRKQVFEIKTLPNGSAVFEVRDETKGCPTQILYSKEISGEVPKVNAIEILKVFVRVFFKNYSMVRTDQELEIVKRNQLSNLSRLEMFKKICTKIDQIQPYPTLKNAPTLIDKTIKVIEEELNTGIKFGTNGTGIFGAHHFTLFGKTFGSEFNYQMQLAIKDLKRIQESHRNYQNCKDEASCFLLILNNLEFYAKGEQQILDLINEFKKIFSNNKKLIKQNIEYIKAETDTVTIKDLDGSYSKVMLMTFILQTPFDYKGTECSFFSLFKEVPEVPERLSAYQKLALCYTSLMLLPREQSKEIIENPYVQEIARECLDVFNNADY
jgi:hypothetical protein